MENKLFAEVVESSLSIWRAQCWEWDKCPAFGSLVVIDNQEGQSYGLVFEIISGSKDPSRTVIAYKKSQEELKLTHPQIFEFLSTSFSCLSLGFMKNGIIYYQLPPEPPKIHAFVRPATLLEAKQLFSNEHYLHVLFNYASKLSSLEELLLAILKQISEQKILTKEIFTNFTDTFSLLTANDYRRLKLFLQRAEPIVQY